MKKTQVEEESRVIVGAHGVAAEEDHLVLGKVVRVGVIALSLFAAGVVWAWRLQVSVEQEMQPDGPPPKPVAIGQYEIGIVNQRMFEHDSHAVEKLSEQRQALKNGWGDRPGVATHLPIEQAMDRVIADSQKPPPAPAPEMAPAPDGKAPAPTPGVKAPAPAPGVKAPAPAPVSPTSAPTPK